MTTNRLSHPSIVFPKIPKNDYKLYCNKQYKKVCGNGLYNDKNVIINLDNKGDIKISTLHSNFITSNVYPWNKTNSLFTPLQFSIEHPNLK